MSEERSEYKIEGRPSTIFRTVKCSDNPYVMVDMRPILNEKLSWKAKGILVYLLSRPDGWEVNLIDLTNRSADGLAAVKSGCKELKEAGHLKHAGIRKASGQFDTVIWEVYETPQVGNQLTDEPHMGVSPEVDFPSPEVEKPHVEKPHADNRTQVLSTLNNKEVNNIKDNNENSIFVDRFRHFNGKHEQKRWEILVQAIGNERAVEIADWAERQEIHMTNRGRLMDSLETAAKKWTDSRPIFKPKQDTRLERLVKA